MIVKQIFPTKSKSFLKAFKDAHGFEYKPTFADAVPKYILVDEKYEPILKEKKVLVDDKIEVQKVETIYTQTQIMTLQKAGNQIQIISEKFLQEKKQAEKDFQTMLENVRFEAIEDYKKQQAKLQKQVEKEVTVKPSGRRSH